MLLLADGAEDLDGAERQPGADGQPGRVRLIHPRWPLYVIPRPANRFLIGATTIIPQTGKGYPVKGEDFGYLVWRKRNCCML